MAEDPINPYWDTNYKPHIFDPDEVCKLCFEAYCILASSHTAMYDGSPLSAGLPQTSEGVEEEDTSEIPSLYLLYREHAEKDIKRILLRLAILFRSLDDQLWESEDWKDFKKALDSKFPLMPAPLYDENLKSEDPLFRGGIRTCCNKIIHAEDFRAVYGRDCIIDSHIGYFMGRQFELTGTDPSKKKEWCVSFRADHFLELILETVNFVQQHETNAPNN